MEQTGHGPTERSRAWAVAGLTLFGAALRLASLNTRSFWLDETTSVRQASWPIPEMLAQMADNVHPPLFHTLLHFWILAFGRAEIAIRAFPVIWGIAAIPLAYWAAKAVYDRRVGVVAAALMALAPFFVWYSQEARMYSMMLVFALLSTGSMAKAMRTRHLGWWSLYAVATALGTMTQYFFLFLVAAQAVYFVVFRVVRMERRLAPGQSATARWKAPWRVFADVPESGAWLGALVFAALPSVWWIPQVLQHTDLLRGISQPFNYGWPPPVFGAHFNEQILVPAEWLFGFHSTLAMHDIVAMWPLLITAAFVLGGMVRRYSPRTWFLIYSGAGGAAAISLLGTWQPILEARYFMAVGVPLVILAARLLTGLGRTALRATATVLVAVALVAWADQSFDPYSVVKWDNRQAMQIVSQDFQSGDVILLVPYFVSSIPEYYLPPAAYAAVQKVPSFDRLGRPRNSVAQLGTDLSRQVGIATRVWVIATWQDTPRIALDRRNTGAWLTSHGYHVVQDRQMRQIRVTLYEGTPSGGGGFFIAPGAPGGKP